MAQGPGSTGTPTPAVCSACGSTLTYTDADIVYYSVTHQTAPPGLVWSDVLAAAQRYCGKTA